MPLTKKWNEARKQYKDNMVVALAHTNAVLDDIFTKVEKQAFFGFTDREMIHLDNLTKGDFDAQD